jgi:acyl-CoA reductase-like NAD-dependent aldehyde dehydrogenase
MFSFPSLNSGKSPVVVDESVRDMALAARRIIWGKSPFSVDLIFL